MNVAIFRFFFYFST
ncbi:pheST operon leader peptide PheM [Salmonella enterica]|uniref:pheST attenuator peptide n=1 Tax=Shigella dysenteriae TaxID=622 RepID=A0A3R0XE53_SHIDY|nr:MULTISPECIES: pheST operon leader peptide PheM [Enterobacteriaceae]EDQ1074945.1 pheST operon leader peptide PheM [Salmonella enterica]EDR5667166.1 pheST operon leader peptide PheM [Salmonella enterica subsp. houtenae serovar 50:z4,z23:-]EDV3250783.1 pheST operon leader peptide PheM [Salmonella enterica subsp. houtenae]EDW0439447.1 pheST operon leader peptide PheM [Salmonella enterica subsp. arizonae serovar 50:z4,z23:-]EGE2518243.1 hypothetical protein [Shigella dysenteriae]